MRMKIWAASAAIAFGVSAGVFAQDPQTSPASKSMSDKTITVTGCIERAQQTPTGTSGATGATSASETKFVLTNTAVGTSGAAGTSGATAESSTSAASQYRLDFDEAKLSPHVGHKVEITGKLDESSPSTSTTESASSASSSGPRLKVDNVKMLASTCPSSK